MFAQEALGRPRFSPKQGFGQWGPGRPVPAHFTRVHHRLLRCGAAGRGAGGDRAAWPIRGDSAASSTRYRNLERYLRPRALIAVPPVIEALAGATGGGVAVLDGVALRAAAMQRMGPPHARPAQGRRPCLLAAHLGLHRRPDGRDDLAR